MNVAPLDHSLIKVSAQDIDQSIIPGHVAIIMDGNGRWAERNGLSRLKGHRQGLGSVRGVIEGALELKIPYLTLFAFSTENWCRPLAEVKGIFSLLNYAIRRDLQELHNAGIRINFFGERAKLEEKSLKVIDQAVELTQNNKNLHLNIALNYGSRSEIILAVKKVAEDVLKGNLTVEKISEEVFSSMLFTKDIPDPDLLIRTSGEFRISNFLLWQLAYAELLFTQEYWPDFSKETFFSAIHEYQKRERRFGKLSSA